MALAVLGLGPTLAPPGPPPPPPGSVRVISYNLRNFPVLGASPGDLPALEFRRDPPHDPAAIASDLAALAPDVIAFQEIVAPAALDDLLDPHAWARAVTRSGGARDQHVVLAWRTDRFVRRGPVRQLDGVAVTEALRPGLAVRLRHRASGADFFVVAVHLKAGRSGGAVRRTQWSELAAAVDRLERIEPDVIVAGDFNVAGWESQERSSEAERRALETRLAQVGMRPVQVGECTAYWEGVRRDGWLEPSRLDLAFVAGFEDLAGAQPRGFAAGHCLAHACRPLRSTPSYPDPAAAGRSDHCPVVIDIPVRALGGR